MSIFAAPPDVLHFYSYTTGVSIELPVGFTVDDEGSASVTYIDEDGTEPVRVQVQVVGALQSGDARSVVTRLADAFADQPNETVRRSELVVDECPAAIVVSRRNEDGWWLHQSVVAGDGKVIAIVAMAPPDAGDELMTELDTAVASVRLVSL